MRELRIAEYVKNRHIKGRWLSVKIDGVSQQSVPEVLKWCLLIQDNS